MRDAAGMMAVSCLLLGYSAYVVPMQLSFWITDDLCNPFPTLYSDVVVDTYFMVRLRGPAALGRPEAPPPDGDRPGEMGRARMAPSDRLGWADPPLARSGLHCSAR